MWRTQIHVAAAARTQSPCIATKTHRVNQQALLPGGCTCIGHMFEGDEVLDEQYVREGIRDAVRTRLHSLRRRKQQLDERFGPLLLLVAVLRAYPSMRPFRAICLSSNSSMSDKSIALRPCTTLGERMGGSAASPDVRNGLPYRPRRWEGERSPPI